MAPPPLAVCSTGSTAQFGGVAGAGDGEPTDPPSEGPTEGPTQGPTEGPTEGPFGECVTASNRAHVTRGRAEHRLGHAYVLGSADPLGLWNTAVRTSLTATSADRWELTQGGC
jgi:hypothetical protein